MFRTNNFTSTVENALERAEKAVGDALDHPFWNILDHPEFPFITVESVTNTGRNFPPYDIVELTNGVTRLDIAVAGFTKDRLSVELEGSVLNIIGKPYKPTDAEVKAAVYRKRGISNASFLRSFSVQSSSIIDRVTLADGILSIMISTKQPETTKTTFQIS